MNFPSVRRGSFTDVQAPPWECKSAWGLMAGLPADPSILQKHFDRVLNVPSNHQFDFVAAGPAVLLSIQRIEGFHSTGVPADERIDYSYNEAAIWVPILDRKNGNVTMVLPYVFHDATIPAAIGRELYGFAKETSMVEISPDRRSLAVKVLGFNNTGDPATWVDLLSLKADGGTTSQREMVGKNLFGRPDQKRMVEPLIAKEAYTQILGGQPGFVFLRQFRAPDGDECDLRQFVSVPLVLRDPVLTAHESSYRLDLSAPSSHRLAEELGLQLDANNSITLTEVMTAEFAFELGKGRIL